jgi:hypothetical protein
VSPATEHIRRELTALRDHRAETERRRADDARRLRRLVVIAHRSGMNPTDISTAVGIARQRVYKILDAER